MKNLILSVIRTLWKRKLQVSLLFILVFVAGILYSFVDVSLSAVSKASDQFDNNSRPEQFRYMISKSFSDADISSMVTRYDITKTDREKSLDQLVQKYRIDMTEFFKTDNELLMKKFAFESEPVRKKYSQEKFNMKNCNYHIRVMQNRINTPIFVTGFQPYANGEIAVSKLFAEKNGIIRGTHITIQNKDYVVSGTYIEPDEVVVYSVDKSANVSTETNAGVLMLVNDFNSLDLSETVYYVGRFADGNENNARLQVANMSKEPNVLYATMSAEYLENSVLSTIQGSNTSLMIFALFLIYLILAFAIIIQISNQFNHFRKSMGVLLALGVAKNKIAFSYSVYFFIFAIATALGIVSGYISSEGFINALNNMYNIMITRPPADIQKYSIFVAVTAVSLTVFVMIFAYLETNRKPLKLIYASEKQKVGLFSRIVKRMIAFMQFGTRIKIAVALRRGGRLMTMLLTFVIASNMLGLGISLNSSTTQVYSDYQKYLKFDHVDYYETSMNNVSAQYREADVFIDESVKIIRNESTKSNINYSFTMEGLAQNQKSLDLRNDKLSEGIIIPLAVASKHNISVNDELLFLIDGQNYKYKVADINGVALDNKIYINITEMYKLDKYSSGDFIGAYIMNNSKANGVSYSITSQDLIEMSRSFNESTTSVSGIMFGLSIVVSLALIILVTTFNFNDSMVHVTLLKFFGYSNRKSNNMLINVFDPVAFIGCALGMLTIPFLMTTFESAMMASSNFYIPFRATWVDRILTAVILLVMYQLCKGIINLVLRNRTTAKILRSA